MSEHYEPEVGQMLFGCASGPYEMSQIGDACLQAVMEELGRVYGNRHQRSWNREDDPRITGLIFRPYYWGDCDCGGEERLSKWTEKHSESCYQTEYRNIPENLRHSYHGAKLVEYKRIVHDMCERRGIPWNDGLGCAAHCDCGHDRRWREFATRNGCTAECSTVRPNLATTDGVEIRWYKNSRRGTSVNRPMTPGDWAAWLSRALQTIQAQECEWMKERSPSRICPIHLSRPCPERPPAPRSPEGE